MQHTPRAKHPRDAGIQARAAILNAIQARLDAGEPCPTITELVDFLHVNRSTLRAHLQWLADDGAIVIRESRREVVRKEVCLASPEQVAP